MSDKSHVGMGYSVCPVCGTQHDEVVLLDRRLKPTLESRQAVGWAFCPEHAKLKADGYVALIECNNSPKDLNDADRTGQVAHVRATAFANIFNRPAPAGGICFVEVGVIDKLKGMVPA